MRRDRARGNGSIATVSRGQAGYLGQDLAPLDVSLRQETADQRGRLVHLLVEREMPGVQVMDFGIRNVAPIGLRFGQGERRIVLAPQDKQQRPPVPQPGLP